MPTKYNFPSLCDCTHVFQLFLIISAEFLVQSKSGLGTLLVAKIWSGAYRQTYMLCNIYSCVLIVSACVYLIIPINADIPHGVISGVIL